MLLVKVRNFITADCKPVLIINVVLCHEPTICTDRFHKLNLIVAQL